jgi:hypothetical protein
MSTKLKQKDALLDCCGKCYYGEIQAGGSVYCMKHLLDKDMVNICKDYLYYREGEKNKS